MNIEKTKAGVTINLTKAEAKSLLVDLGNAGASKHSGDSRFRNRLIDRLRETVAEPTVSAREAALAIEAAADDLHLKDDRDDLFAIAALLCTGNFRAAKTLTANLDTAVRDEIPRCAWSFVGLVGIHD